MTFLVMSDLHLSDPAGSPGAAAHADFVGACLETAAGTWPGADFCVLTGDLTNHGEPGAYLWLKRRLDALPFPAVPLLGNHDDRAAFFSTFGRPADGGAFAHTVRRYGERFMVFLDTLDPGSDAGVLCADRLGWLDRQLAEAGEAEVWLFMHHPPCDIGDPVLDPIKLANAGALLSVLRRHGNVRRIFFGHVHRNMQLPWHGIPCISLDALGDAASHGTQRRPPAVGLVRQAGDELAISFETLAVR